MAIKHECDGCKVLKETGDLKGWAHLKFTENISSSTIVKQKELCEQCVAAVALFIQKLERTNGR